MTQCKKIDERFQNEAFCVLAYELYRGYIERKIGLGQLKDAYVALELLQDLQEDLRYDKD